MRDLPYKCGELTSVQREETTQGKPPTGAPFSEGTWTTQGSYQLILQFAASFNFLSLVLHNQ